MVWPTPTMTGTRLVFAAVSTLYLDRGDPVRGASPARDFGPAYDAYARDVRWRMVPVYDATDRVPRRRNTID